MLPAAVVDANGTLLTGNKCRRNKCELVLFIVSSPASQVSRRAAIISFQDMFLLVSCPQQHKIIL